MTVNSDTIWAVDLDPLIQALQWVSFQQDHAATAEVAVVAHHLSVDLPVNRTIYFRDPGVVVWYPSWVTDRGHTMAIQTGSGQNPGKMWF